MDQFIVSARKYRPQTFDTVVGQDHITTTLKNAIRTGQLAHAFLFCGPRGVGKTTCARILAKTINCENLRPDGEACDTCTSCRTFNEGTSLNIHELDAASNNSVDDIRSLVEQVRFAPQAGKYKVYIVDEVHMLSSSAFNAFLKTLEEPPSYAIFILATTEKHKILPTILSRCQTFDFKRITLVDTVRHLRGICDKEGVQVEDAALQVIAQKSEGCLRDALSIMDKIVSFTGGHLTYASTLEHLNILDDDYYFRLLEYLKAQKLTDALLVYDDINRKGFEGDLVLGGLAEFFRNIMVCKDERASVLLDAVDAFRDKYKAAAASTDTGFCMSALNILGEAELGYKGARNKRLHVELALIKLAYLSQALDLADVMTASGPAGPDQLSAGKRRSADSPVGFRRVPIVVAPMRKQAATPTSTTPETAPADGPRLVIETSAATPAPPPPTEAVSTENAPETRIPPSLQQLRKQIASRHAGPSAAATPLTEGALRECWTQFIRVLQEKKNHSAVTNFSLARLQIVDDNNFLILTEAPIQQKFIEQERTGLGEHIQSFFNNKQLGFQVQIEAPSTPTVAPERPLNTKELFQQMAEQYPLVRELKDKLKLDLDY